MAAFTVVAGCVSPSKSETHANPSDATESTHHVNISSKQIATCQLASTSPTTQVGAGISLDGRSLTRLNTARVVNVAMGAGQSVAALGFTRSLVGRDLASGGTDIAGVPIVTDAHSVNAEKVLAQHPTVVLADAQSTPQTALKQISDAGVPIVKLPSAWSMQDIEPRLLAIATALGDPSRATALSAHCQQSFGAPIAKQLRVAFLYLRGTAAIYLLGGKGSGADSLISAAGAVDVGAQAGLKPFTPITPEVMAGLKPDVLLLMTKGLESVGGMTGLRQMTGLRMTPAVQNQRVISVEDTLLLAFGSQTWALVAAIRQAIEDVTR